MQEITKFLADHPYLTSACISILIALMFVEYLRARAQTFEIDRTQATHKINRDRAVVADIRGNDAFVKGHIIDALSFENAELLNNTTKLDKYRARPIIVVCTAGISSKKVAAHLIKEGYNAYSLTGGMRGWIDADMPLVKD